MSHLVVARQELSQARLELSRARVESLLRWLRARRVLVWCRAGGELVLRSVKTGLGNRAENHWCHVSTSPTPCIQALSFSLEKNLHLNRY
jgi:hypothetical protein